LLGKKERFQTLFLATVEIISAHHEPNATQVLATLGARETLHMVPLIGAGGRDHTVLDKLLARMTPSSKVETIVGLKLNLNDERG